jgi:hypothetical protein
MTWKVNLFTFILLLCGFGTYTSFAQQSADTLISGLDVVGCGFDVTTMESRLCLFDLNDANLSTYWSDPHNQSLVYRVPHGFYAMDTSDYLEVLDTRIIKNIYELISKTFYHSRRDSSGFLGFSSSSRTVPKEFIHHRFYQFDNYLASTIRQVAWYSLNVMTFPVPKFDSQTIQSIGTLPSTFNPMDETHVDLFNQFFRSFGTHLVTGSAMGGLIWSQDWFDSCLLRIRNTTWVFEQVNSTFHQNESR